MTRSKFNKLIAELKELGATKQSVKRIGTSLSIRTEALIKHEIKKLKNAKDNNKSVVQEKVKAVMVDETPYKPKADFKDFISEYPVELHSVYLERSNSFLQACALKLKLNKLQPAEEKQAAKLQWAIWDLFMRMDKAKKVLDYWKKNKRMLPVETKEDFSTIPPKQLHLKLRNLRSNRSKRTKTIKKLQESLPDVDAEDFKTKYNLLNRKLEELQELELQIEKLTNIINS